MYAHCELCGDKTLYADREEMVDDNWHVATLTFGPIAYKAAVCEDCAGDEPEINTEDAVSRINSILEQAATDHG